MQGWHDKQVGVGTQPYRFPLLPKGPDTTQGLSLWLLTWMDKDYSICRAEQHTTYLPETTTYPQPTPSSASQGRQFPRRIPRDSGASHLQP